MASVKDLGNGKYKIWISLGFNSDNTRDRVVKTIKAKDLEKAKAKAAVLENKYKEEGYQKPVKYTFDELFQKWLDSHQGEKQLSIKTKTRYQQMHKSRIKDYFAKYKPEKVNALIIDEFFTQLRQSDRLDKRPGKLSEQSVKHHWRLLFSVFNWACQKDILQKNPMLKAEKVSLSSKEPESYDQDQADLLFNALEMADLKRKVLIYLAIDTGCRRGELVGLTWDNVNLKKSQVTIMQEAQYISEIGKSITIEDILAQYPDTPRDLLDRKIVITPPKTEKSNRIINISPTVKKLLEQWQHEQKVQKMSLANKWKNSNWVFTDSYGDLLNPNLPSKWHKKLLEDNNLPPLRFHGLRHSCASLLLDHGQNIAAISKRLGHSTVHTTTRIYIHSNDTQDQRSAKKMDSIFKRQTKKNVKQKGQE